MMKTSTKNLRTLLILFLIAFMPLVQGQQKEIEYEGITAYYGLMDDGALGMFPIGFDFDFYGNTYSDFYVTSNGLVMFDTISTAYDNVTIPTADNLTGDTVNNYIAPFWDDIMIYDEGDIQFLTVGASPNKKCIIQFHNMDFFASTILLGTFQVILYEGSNNIQIQYRDILDLSSARSSGNSATVGLENVDGTIGVLCSYNTAGYVYSGRAIQFTPGGGTYTFDDNALYDAVILTDSIPEPGSVDLISPAYNSTVGQEVTFLWEEASNASTYSMVISTNSDLSSPFHTSADLTTLSYDYSLTPGLTYFWTVFPKNSDDSTTLSDIWTFHTSLTPSLTAVPQTFDLEQGDLQKVKLIFTGGDTGAKTATVVSLPAAGALYQNNAGIPGAQITTVPTVVTDASFNVIYSANGATGNGAGNFDFHFADGTGTSADDSIVFNVSPLGAPNFLEACYESTRVELIFDRNMADPTGLHSQFAVQGNSIDATTLSCSLKEGDSSTIVVNFSPAYDIDITTIDAAYTRGTVTSSKGGILESFDFHQAIKQSQTMTFAPLADRTFGDPDFTLSATTTFGFPISYRSEDPLIVSITGSTATIVNVGEILIYAVQEGNDSIQPVKYAQVQRVNKAAATVTLSDLTQEYTGSGIAATVTTVPAALDVIVTYNGSSTLPVNFGSYTVLAVVDDPNYMGTASDQLVITDLTAPVPDVAPLPDLLGECSLTPAAPTATDANIGAVIGTTVTPFPIVAQGTTMITWSYDDGYGNIATQNQNVILDDVTNPVTPTLADLTDECSVTAIAPSTTDACVGVVVGTTTDPLTYSSQGAFVINWTFNDGNGNSIIVPQNVIVNDVTDPVTPTLANLTGECSVTAIAPSTTDACAGAIVGTTTDPLTYSSEGAFVINWTFNDGNGNSIIVPQNVIVDDVTDPVTPTLVDLTGECSVTAVAPSTTDVCAGTIVGTTTDPLTYSSQGAFVINWTFNDGNGNSIVVPQNVIIDDVTDPVTPVLGDVSGECSATVAAPTTNDACAGTITGTTSDPTTYSTDGTYVITWTFDDGFGNSIDVTQNVIVDDATDPVTPTLPDLTGDCSVTATAPSTTDACAGTINGTTTDPLTYSTQGAYVITWTFDDGNGNSIDVDQNVLVADVTDPVIPTLPDVTGACSATAGIPTTTDVCAGTITGSTTDALTYVAQGTHVITWTFDDGNGNRITVDQNVIVDDVTAPTATAPADVASCDGTVSSIGLTAVMDNCTTPVVTYVLSGATTGTGTGADASAELFSPGATTVTYTVDDGNGNSTEYSLIVTYVVVDDIVVTVSGGALTCETTGTYQWINCADNSIIAGETASTYRPGVNGEYAVILTQSGCSDTSDCFSLDYTGIDDNRSQDYKVYPNPAQEYVTIEMVNEQTNATIQVIDMTGQIIQVEELDRFIQTDLDVSRFKAGVYLIQIRSDQVNSVARMIKE